MLKKKLETIEEPMLETGDSICPACGVAVDYRCRLCGATKSINSVSGNVIWMRNGRLIAGFKDEKQAFLNMAERWNVPESLWPDKFKPDFSNKEEYNVSDS